MNFLNLSTAAVFAGLAALAGLLYLLQQLRVRHTEIAVPTTMFWAAAAREAPVRVFRRRFRHFLAYLLALAICALLWIGFAGPEAGGDRAADYHVLFLDGSAHTSDPDEFDAAKRQLVDDVAGLPLGTREVIFGGAYNVKLLTAGEDKAVLERRLETLTPEAAPSRLDDQLRLMGTNGSYPESVKVVVYGRAPVREGTLNSLPAGYSVTRSTDYAASQRNRGISALGIGEAQSGIWGKFDVAVSVATTPDLEVDASDLSFSLDGQATGLAVSALGDGRFAIRDVAADGATLEVRINAVDSLPLDNVARIVLPELSVVKVAIDSGSAASIAMVIAADDGLELVDDIDEADVVVKDAAASVTNDAPTMFLSPMDQQETAFTIGYTGGLDVEAALKDTVSRIGLDQIDGAELATAVDRELGLELYDSNQRSVAIWSELLDGRYNFTGSRSFPVFIARTLRWLAGEDAWYAYAAAGRPLYDQTARSSLASAGNAFDALGADYVPGRAGSLQRDGEPSLEVSLLNDVVSDLSGGAALDASTWTVADTAASVDFITWLILAVLLLLGVEWYFYQRGLMP